MCQLVSGRVNMWHMLGLVLLLLLWPVAASTESICGSLELRKISDFEQLRNCSIVVGHVRIAQLQLPNTLNNSGLRTDVTEITDYLMVYRCTGLITLESIFPKLRIIRGRQLLFNKYALTVYENRNLRELGLLELQRIQDGSIRVENNPTLCFVHTVDWVYLFGNATKQLFYLAKNKSPNNCPVCGGLSAEYSINAKKRYCWNMQVDQFRIVPPRIEDCPKNCGLHGCDAAGNCCQHSCVTGCSAENCTLCGNYQRNGRCVDQCIASYELNKRQCISYRECRQLKRIPLTRGYNCMDRCPNNHKPVINANGTVYCQMNCSGLFHVKRMADLEALQDCVTINGSLIIELVDIKEKIVSALEQALGSIKEITGYLKVLHSAQLMSLTFLGNLDTIRGDQLIENKYALYVVNNYHMEQIWPANRQVAIQRGTIFFHLNPRLCYEKILKLQSSLRMSRKISVADVSPNSNGERVICGTSVRTLNVTVEDKNSTAVRLAVDLMKSDELDTLLGYSYHYMEAPQQNVTMYDGRHGCGHDDWLMDVSPSRNRRHVISNLKPYTQYAYFVKTITRTDYHMQVDAYSKIMYFRTLPSKPSPVSRLHGSSDHSTQIMLYWWPPLFANGLITKYVLSIEPHNLTKEELNAASYATYKTCEKCLLDCACNDLVPYDSGPQPEDENYYNKDQTIYDEALPNLIYVSRRKVQTKREMFGKVKSFEDLIAGPKMIPSALNKSSQMLRVNNTANSTLKGSRNSTKKSTIVNSTVNSTSTFNSNSAMPNINSTIACNGSLLEAKVNSTNNCTAAQTVGQFNSTLLSRNCTSSQANGNSTSLPSAASANSTCATKDNLKVSEADAALQYELFRMYLEKRNIEIQDTGIDDFMILHPMPMCKGANASVGYQLEEKCIVEEQLSGIILPGNQHYYNATNLKPDTYYLISVRACVQGVANGCSKPTEMILKTITVQVEQFMHGN